MKLSASLIFGLLIFFLPYPSLKLLPKAVSQDVQPALSGFFALLSLTFYIRKSSLRSAIPFSVVFPAIYLVCITTLYAAVSVFVSNSAPLGLIIERLLAISIVAIFYLSGAGIAYICSRQPKKISKYFTYTLNVLLIYGSIQLLGVILKVFLGLSLVFDIERLFRELVLTRAQFTPKLVLFITEPSFLPSFLILILLIGLVLLYFNFMHKSTVLSATKLNSYLLKESRFLASILACAVIFSFSISVYVVAIVFMFLFFLLNLVQNLKAKGKRRKLNNLIAIVLLSIFLFFSTVLVLYSDYINLLFGLSPVFRRLGNLQSDPSTIIRFVKLSALTSCSAEHLPFGTGLGGYYSESVGLINQVLSSVTTNVDLSEIRQLQYESEQNTGDLYSVIFGTTCEMGVFGLSAILLMFLPSTVFPLVVSISSKRNQASLLLSLICASGITTLLISVSAIPFVLPYPWVIVGMCNFLLLSNSLKIREAS